MVRPAISADADTLLGLIDALADYEKLPRPTTAARARLLRDGFGASSPRFETLLVTWENEAVGYAILFETYSTFRARPTLYLEDFFVLPDARRRGAGSAVFAYLKEEARRRGCGRIEWSCLNWNQLAIEFYAKQDAMHLDDWRVYRIDIAYDEEQAI